MKVKEAREDVVRLTEMCIVDAWKGLRIKYKA
jgi:hypothetical protein